MPVQYRIDEKLEIVRGSASGVIDVHDVSKAFSELVIATNGRALYLPLLFRAEDTALHHKMDFASLELSKEKIKALRKLYPGTGRVRNAMIVPDSIKDPVGPMWKAMIAADPSLGIDVEVFATEESAIAWLKS